MRKLYFYSILFLVQAMYRKAYFFIVVILFLTSQISFAQKDSILNIQTRQLEQSETEVLQDTTKVDSTSYKETKRFLEGLLKQAEAQVRQEQQLDLGIGIEDLIVSETITKVGADFYDLFNSEWRLIGWPEVEGDYIITITERPFRLRTTQIIITLNDLTVYEAFLQPRLEFLEELSKFTVNLTQAYIINYERIQKDLSSNDLSGSGIY